jgi:hypothetical protein
MRTKTSSFIAEFPLQTSPPAEQVLAIRLEARQSKDWHRARAMKRSKERTELFRQTLRDSSSALGANIAVAGAE